MDTPKLVPADLYEEHLLDIVEQIRRILWRDNEAATEWSPDTVDDIAQVLISYSLKP